jgi:hypothetical protein
MVLAQVVARRCGMVGREGEEGGCLCPYGPHGTVSLSWHGKSGGKPNGQLQSPAGRAGGSNAVGGTTGVRGDTMEGVLMIAASFAAEEDEGESQI